MRVLNKLKEFGLRLSLEKCHFFKKSEKYLGQVISENGVETDLKKDFCHPHLSHPLEKSGQLIANKHSGL